MYQILSATGDALCPAQYGTNAFVLEYVNVEQLDSHGSADQVVGTVAQVCGETELLEALHASEKLIKTARNYFPKSIHNSDRFQLENTAAAVGKAIHNAEKGVRA